MAVAKADVIRIVTGRSQPKDGLVEVGQVALGVDLADEGALTLLGRQQGQPGRDGRLAHATLASDEEQLAIEERRHGRPELAHRGRLAAEADAPVGIADQKGFFREHGIKIETVGLELGIEPRAAAGRWG